MIIDFFVLYDRIGAFLDHLCFLVIVHRHVENIVSCRQIGVHNIFQFTLSNNDRLLVKALQPYPHIRIVDRVIDYFRYDLDM